MCIFAYQFYFLTVKNNKKMSSTTKLTKEFFNTNLDLFFDAYFDTACKEKNVERLIVIDSRLWIKFMSDSKNLQLNFDLLQDLFINELKIWREEFTQYFA
jgi:hypothetical protein